jgi:ribonuclease HII
MIFPTYEIEDKIKAKGFKRVAGVDEVAIGTLVGSVVAAAVIIPDSFIPKLICRVNDSKKLSSRKREELYDLIVDNCDYGIGEISNKEIDRINVFEATKLAMYSAIMQLDMVDYVLIDGEVVVNNLSAPQKQIIKGDNKSMSIAAASIVAKVTKDRTMGRLHEEWPQYGWNANKGYSTRVHKEAIKRYGITPYHRKTFGVCRGEKKNTCCGCEEINMCKKLLESCCSCKNNKNHEDGVTSIKCCKTDYPELSYEFLGNGNRTTFERGLGTAPFPCEFYERLEEL